MDSGTVERLSSTPSQEHFCCDVEPANNPVVFDGLVKDWPAYTKWDPSGGGLDYLKDMAGSAEIQVMVTRHGPNFYGNIGGHERAVISFGEFLDRASTSMTQDTEGIEQFSVENGPAIQATQIYLAQVPIFVKENKEKPALRSLMHDVCMPNFVKKDRVSNINLWMSCKQSRSSTHYDPYHNLLCIVSGCKQVALWPPSATPFLYPFPLYGEASNHSAVDFAEPDYNIYPRFRDATKYCQVANLNAGDALFIPEGWYHQVDTEGMTLAVNIWWPSVISSKFNTHMDSYYLRRVLASLLDSEKETFLQQIFSSKDSAVGEVNCTSGLHSEMVSNCKEDKEARINEPSEVNKTAEMQNKTIQDRETGIENCTDTELQCIEKLVLSVSSKLENASSIPKTTDKDLALDVFWSSTPSSLQRILSAMVFKFPRTLEALILHGLSSAACELLIKKFEEMDEIDAGAAQEFYKKFYSVFDDPNDAMKVLVTGKELFAASVWKSVLEKHIGVNVEQIKWTH